MYIIFLYLLLIHIEFFSLITIKIGRFINNFHILKCHLLLNKNCFHFMLFHAACAQTFFTFYNFHIHKHLFLLIFYNLFKFFLTILLIKFIIKYKKWVFYRTCYLLTAKRGARFFFYVNHII